MRTKPMSVTRRESLRLLGSGLAATAVSLQDPLHHSLPPGNVLDRVRLLQLLGAVPASVPPLAPERVERVDLGDVVREKVTYAVEPGECVPAFVLLPKSGPPRHPAILCHHSTAASSMSGRTARRDWVRTPTSTMHLNWLAEATLRSFSTRSAST